MASGDLGCHCPISESGGRQRHITAHHRSLLLPGLVAASRSNIDRETTPDRSSANGHRSIIIDENSIPFVERDHAVEITNVLSLDQERLELLRIRRHNHILPSTAGRSGRSPTL